MVFIAFFRDAPPRPVPISFEAGRMLKLKCPHCGSD
jgi:hypothetical protein